MIAPDSTARSGVNRALTPGRRRRITENDEYAAFARRVLRAWARRVAAGDIDAITDMAAAAQALDDAMREAVTGLRGAGYSWAEIAARLGVTRQAAQQRWGGSARDLPAPAAVLSQPTDLVLLARTLAGCLPDSGHGTPPRRTRNRAEARPGPARRRRPVCAPASPAASPGDRREALPPPAQHRKEKLPCA